MTLNEAAMRCADALANDAAAYRVAVRELDTTRLIDCGAAVPGGLEAGLQLARICMAGRANISLVPGEFGTSVQVISDDPVQACLASQYAGWQIKVGKYFAMGSGPMRAAYGKEEIFQHIPGHEAPPVAVGVLETRKEPDADVIAYLRERLPNSVQKLTLAYAPASSIAGTIQVVARALETALHKLHSLKFDLSKIVSGIGIAPLPPIAPQELQAIGWTNDAILYGGHVTLWVRAEDDEIALLGPQVPACASKDHGAPFAELFARYGDFYQIDPMLFSPAVIDFVNLSSGRRFRFGRMAPEVMTRSWGA